MPRFHYLAKLNPEKTIEGDIEAETEQEAINKLSKSGYFPISVKSQVSSLEEAATLSRRNFSNKDIIAFTRQLTSLTESGINIIKSLDMIGRQTRNRYIKAIVEDVITKIKDGRSLSESLSLHADLFPQIYSSMVRTGEASGNLQEVMKRLLEFMEKREEFKSSLKASLTYPVFVFSVSVLTIVTLLVFVIPRLVTMFEDMGQALPLPTLLLINSGSFLKEYGWILLIGIFISVFLLKRIYKGPKGKLAWDKLKLKIPVAGRLILQTEVSRLMRTLSLLISSGTPISSSLEIANTTVTNEILNSEIRIFQENIKNGGSLSDSLRHSLHFPEFVVNVVAVGEETGALDKSLLRIADEFDAEIERNLKSFTRLLEPLIILVMGVIVGFIVLSMLLPIFQLNLIVR